MNINDRLLLCKESEGERADLKHEGEARGRFWVQFPPFLYVVPAWVSSHYACERLVCVL